MIAKAVIMLALAWLAYSLYRKFTGGGGGARRKKPPRQLSGTVVACEQCGLHVPQEEAISVNGRYYCSRAHLPR